MLFNDSTKMLNAKVAEEQLAAYKKYAATFPEDSASPAYLFKAADLAHGMRKNKEAIELYGTFISKYPDHPKSPPSLFLAGFIYDTDLQQKDSAKISGGSAHGGRCAGAVASSRVRRLGHAAPRHV
jgi:TolA-binding protein